MHCGFGDGVGVVFMSVVFTSYMYVLVGFFFLLLDVCSISVVCEVL